jgi:hypothetical protein
MSRSTFSMPCMKVSRRWEVIFRRMIRRLGTARRSILVNGDRCRRRVGRALFFLRTNISLVWIRMIIKLLGALNSTLKDVIWFMLMLVEKGAR